MASLLAALEPARAFFAAGPPAPDAVAPPSTEAAVGETVGPYRLIRILAVGGMGSVYLGERVDEAYRKQVAVKLIRPGLDTAEILDRFRHERQVLADLEHPRIARLLDGGSTADGRPYLVMEYVDGEPIDAYCASRDLPVEDRLRLFLAVCDAVQYAHRNLVVHRDLKPSNVMVDRDGEVKLLDFGLARVLEPGAAEAARMTVTGLRALTPRYASPEQIRGGRITTASDVYSLGVVLYELLTGASPYNLEGTGVFDVERAIAAEAPSRPSRRVLEGGGQPRLARRLTGDLDTIALRALAKEPDRRYPGVEELAADIRRHLDGHPVLARPDTVFYRVSRFARRNRALVGAVMAIIATLAVALAVALGANRRVRDAARDAEWTAYASALAAAEYSILRGEVNDARGHLDDAPVALRDWEWRHLMARLDRSRARWNAFRAGVTRMAWSPDGAFLVAGSMDSTAAVWSAGGDSLVARWGPFASTVEAVAVSPDGRTVAIGVGDGSILLADARGGADPALLDTGERWPSLAFSPKGDALSAGFFDGSVATWDLATGERRRSWPAHPKLALVAYSPSGDTLITGGVDGRVTLRDAATGAELATFTAHPKRIYALAVSGDGLLATGSTDRTARIWRLDTQELLADLREHEGTVGSLAFTPDGRSLVTAGADGRVLVWDTARGELRAELRGHLSDVSAVAISPRDGAVAGGDWGGTIRVWDRHAQDVRTQTVPFPGSWVVARIGSVAFDPEGRRVLCGNSEFVASIWHLEPDTMQAIGNCPSTRLAWSPDGTRILWRDGAGHLAWADADADSAGPRGPRPGTDLLALATSPRGDRCVTATADSTVTLHSAPDLAVIRALRLADGPAVCAAFSPDGARLVLGGASGTIRLLDAATGDSLRAWSAHARAVTAVAFLPDGEGLVSASLDGAVRRWNAQTGHLDAIVHEGQTPCFALAAHPGGRLLAAGSADQSVHLYDLSRNRLIVRLHGHAGRVTALAFSPDGSLLASGATDGRLRVWDAPSRSTPASP